MQKAVLLITFNRLDYLQEVFEAIKLVQPPRLYIASDGPRESVEGEKEIVERIRKWLLDNVTWDCEVKTRFLDKNSGGCAYGVSGAVTWFFENEEDGIILEDDCVPNQSFFKYCEELLDKYKDDKRVWHIAGSADNSYKSFSNESYYFSPFMHCWGWASWANRWKHFKLNLKDYDKNVIYKNLCPASPPAYQGKKAIFTTKTCVLGAINMLDLAKKNNAKILQSSTSEVYGEPLVHPQVEAYRGNVNPIGIRACYDEGKRCAESLFFDYYRNYGVKIKVIRIFNTYGPNMDPNDGRVVSNFICQALRGEDLTIYGDGSQTRSFCYIDDLIDVIIRMMNSEDGFVGPVNTGNPGEFTIKELAELVKEKINPNLKISYKILPLDDPTQRKPDISLAKEKLGWEPKIKLNEGLDKTIEYFKTKIGEKV